MTRPVLTARHGGVLTVTLNRPEKRNALTAEMYTLLADTLAEAAEDPETRVLLLSGAGDAFTAGNDLRAFGEVAWRDGDDWSAPVLRLMEQMIEFPKPVVAAVRGPAVGIGTTILLHCDLVIAERRAHFALPFTRLGLVPEFGCSVLLPLLAGRARAMQAMLMGNGFDGDRARELGIVSEVCEDGRARPTAEFRARALAALPPRALRETKRLVVSAEVKARLREVILAENRAFREGLESAEHKEAVAAFFEKRQADFGRFD